MKDLRQAVGEADLVLHATDALFDPPPPSFPRHHHHVGPLLWEPASEAPTYLDVPGAPWVLVTLSSEPQPEEMTLARTALRTLTEFPVRIVLTLSARHPRDELGSVPANARIEQFVPTRRCSNAAASWSATRGTGLSPKPSTTVCLWCWCPGTGISRVWQLVRLPSG
jgi:UDP:flavonoid glycosyltransferase YjiC (YdhE family)